MRRLKPWAVALPGLLAAGCANFTEGPGWYHIDNAAAFPRGAIPAPTGTYVNQWADAHAAKAEADDLVIYKHEWYMGGLDLGPYGHYHLVQIVKRLPTMPYPVLLQAVPDPAVNETRRNLIVQALAMAGVPDPEHRVIVGFAEAEGLFGDEAERIYGQLIGGRDRTGGNGAREEFGPFNDRFSPFSGFRGGFRGGLGGGFSGF
jgi:hypothetical protein